MYEYIQFGWLVGLRFSPYLRLFTMRVVGEEKALARKGKAGNKMLKRGGDQ